MVEYSEINCKLTNVQLNKFKKAVKSNEGATLKLGIRNFNKNETPHKLLLTRQNTKLRNAVNDNSATDINLSKTHKKNNTIDINDIMKIIEALENSGILLKGVTKTIENETKEQKGGFLSMLLGTLGASLLGNLLSRGKGIVTAGEANVASRAKGDGIVRAGEGSKKN